MVRHRRGAWRQPAVPGIHLQPRPDAVKALKATHRKLPKKLNDEHDESLPREVAEDWRYDFRVLLLPQTGPKTESDAVMRFVREDEIHAGLAFGPAFDDLTARLTVGESN